MRGSIQPAPITTARTIRFRVSTASAARSFAGHPLDDGVAGRRIVGGLEMEDLDGLEEAGAHVDRAPGQNAAVPHGRPKLAGLHQLPARRHDRGAGGRRAGADTLPTTEARLGLWKTFEGDAAPPRRHAPGIEEDVGTELLLGDLAPREGLDLHGAPQRHPLFLHPLADGRRGDAQQPRQISQLPPAAAQALWKAGLVILK
jgi:hypothetical protein